MYLLNDGFTYYDNSGQHRSRGAFLLLLDRDNADELRAIVRKVALSQCGHFMMGTARVFGQSIPVSGAYGSDGLPRTIDRMDYHLDDNYKVIVDNPQWVDRVWQSAVPLPDHLYAQWANGGGWNSAGREAPAIRQWAIETFGL